MSHSPAVRRSPLQLSKSIVVSIQSLADGLSNDNNADSLQPDDSDPGTSNKGTLAGLLPVVPTASEIHEHWDPKYQAVAKCDFCHARVSQEKTAGVLQLCRDCKMSICHDCCTKKHEAASGRLEILQTYGVADGLTESQRRWCLFGIQARHTLDPNSVNWELPPKKRRTATKTNTAHEGRGRGEARGGRRQVSVRRSARLSAPQFRSEIIASEDYQVTALTPSHYDADPRTLDTEEGIRRSYALRSSRGVKNARDESSSSTPDHRAAEEAADVLTRLSSTPELVAGENNKRLKVSHETTTPDYGQQTWWQTRPPQGYPLEHLERPSLPPFASLMRRDHSSFEPIEPRIQSQPHISGGTPPHRSQNTPRSHPYAASPPVFHDEIYTQAHDTLGRPRHQAKDGGRETIYDQSYSNNQTVTSETRLPRDPVEPRPIRQQRLQPMERVVYDHHGPYINPSHGTQSYDHGPYPAVQDTDNLESNIYRPTIGVEGLAMLLTRKSRWAQYAAPQDTIDKCLERELIIAWRSFRPDASRGDTLPPLIWPQDMACAFQRFLSATYLAMFRLKIEANGNNRVRCWLRSTEEQLEQRGIPVRQAAEE